MNQEQPKFELKFISPYSTLENGEPIPIPFIINGLLTQGGFSALGAKPKQGKSSLSRYEAVCVAKGIPCLGRDTVRGEVILISLEDPLNHVDNCLKALDYNPETDERIQIIGQLPSDLKESITLLEEALYKMPNIRLVIVDTLAKLLRLEDLNKYMPTLEGVEQLHNLARKFPHLHIQGLAHCKKVLTDDPFDSLLGSTALRGEPDTNIALFKQSGEHVIVTETRMGRNIVPTILKAQLIESAGCDVVKDFSLDGSFDEWEAKKKEKAEKKDKLTYNERIIQHLLGCEDHTDTQQSVMQKVTGRDGCLVEAIEELKSAGVLTTKGVKQSPVDPLKLTLNPDRLPMYRLGQFGMKVN